jgi:hypothetical protein
MLISYEIAQRRVKSFRERFGEAHFYFACHAAFPLALTSDLLYQLWANFQWNIYGEPLEIPWIAVADLLLSGLCDEVGHELYEMHIEVRNILLAQLRSESQFEITRLLELSEFLLVYIEQNLDSHDTDIHDFSECQRWLALSYVRPSEAAQEIGLKLSQLKLQEKTEWIRLKSIVETFTSSLASFQPLLSYVNNKLEVIDHNATQLTLLDTDDSQDRVDSTHLSTSSQEVKINNEAAEISLDSEGLNLSGNSDIQNNEQPTVDVSRISNTQPQRIIDFTVQIRHTTTNAIVGTGFVASEEGEIVTCRHVVEMAGVDPARATGQTVGIVFPRTRSREEKKYRAQVIKCFPDYDDDVVVLLATQPMGLQPSEVAVLGTAERSGGNPFRSYGFRTLGSSFSGYAEGTIVGPVLPFDGQKLQVDPIELRTRDIRPGMSGAPVLDMKRNLVVALISQRWNPGDPSVDDNVAWATDNYVFKFEPVHLEFFDRD